MITRLTVRELNPIVTALVTALITIANFTAIALAGAAEETQVTFKTGPQRIDVQIRGKPFTTYRFDDSLPKPVLFPARTPSGIAITRGFPLNPAKDESQDHPHHAGIFFAYDQVNGNNFWRNTARSPRIEHVRVVAQHSRDATGTLTVALDWIGTDEKVVLSEARSMTFGGERELFLLDHDSRLTAAGQQVVFGDTKEGLLGIRVADGLRETFRATEGVVDISGSGSGKYLASGGREGEPQIWGQRLPWVALQGSLEGRAVGVAIFEHPSSFNHPTYWHTRGYGLFAANPLGRAAFEEGSAAEKPKPLNLTLAAGQSVRFRYRLIVYDGSKTRDELDRYYEAFAKSP